MSDMSQVRFAEYATSAAVNDSLIRSQVGALSPFADRDEWQSTGDDSLVRKDKHSASPPQNNGEA